MDNKEREAAATKAYVAVRDELDAFIRRFTQLDAETNALLKALKQRVHDTKEALDRIRRGDE